MSQTSQDNNFQAGGEQTFFFNEKRASAAARLCSCRSDRALLLRPHGLRRVGLHNTPPGGQATTVRTAREGPTAVLIQITDIVARDSLR